MAITNFQETVFFHYILSNPIFLNTTKSEFFTNTNVKELFEIAKDYTLKYKESPSKEQLIQLVQVKGLSDKYNDDMITALYNNKNLLVEYGNEWLENNVGPWIQVRNLDNVMRKAIAYMKTTTVTAENASEVVEKIRNMLSNETAIDFKFDLGADFFDAASHVQTKLARTSTGYDYVNLCTKGGYWKGSLIVILGASKSGKSLWLCNLAAKSVLEGYNTAYITLELQREIVSMRIGSNLLNIPYDDYEKITQDQSLLKQKLAQFKQKSLKPLGQLHIKEFPSSAASANDISSYLKKSQELLGYKFDNIFIDYINIMKNWRNPNTENTYMKIKQISEDLRAAAQQNCWTMIVPTQTNRLGWLTSDINITALAESGGLLHTVDLLFAIIADPTMKAAGEYYLKCLANRVAGYENTKKRYTVDWKYMRIEEDRMSPIQDIDFMINNMINPEKHKTPRGYKHPTMHEVISSKTQTLEQTPDNKFVSDINISGDGLF